MEVTKHNYREALKEVTALLKNADFISFDSEFSGLGSSLGDKNHDLDTPEERYQKSRKRVQEYGLIQTGITIFRSCPIKKKYYSATYCFFLAGKLDGSYRYDASSMTFLAENCFDFNKLFIEGLPFMTLLDEQAIRQKRSTKLIEERVLTSTPLKVRDEAAKLFVKDAMDKVNLSLKDKSATVVFPGKSLNSFYRKLLFNNVGNSFPNSYVHTTRDSERNIVVQHFDSEEGKLKYLGDKWEDDLNERLGFTHFVKAILESGVPLVGHNMMLDLLHLVDKFITPLPESLEEFKSTVKANLPTFYDTKLIASDPPFSADIMNTALGNLYEELTSNYNPPEVDVEKGYRSYTIAENGQAHDGGYDAFMTGICFLTMLKRLGDQNWGNKPLMKSKFLPSYANKLYFMQSYDIPSIDINKAETIPDRSFIFCVDCPATFTTIDVRKLFSSLKSYKTVWVNDNSLFVVPQDEDDITKAKEIVGNLKLSNWPNVRVSLYKSKIQRTSNGNNRHAAKSRTKPPQCPQKPMSIGLKRRSNSKETKNEGEVELTSTDDADSSRNLKRLKSVGSEQLSNMTLESPIKEDKPLHSSFAKDVEFKDQTEVFPLIDEW